jgi:hypothetical protein
MLQIEELGWSGMSHSDHPWGCHLLDHFDLFIDPGIMGSLNSGEALLVPGVSCLSILLDIDNPMIPSLLIADIDSQRILEVGSVHPCVPFTRGSSTLAEVGGTCANPLSVPIVDRDTRKGNSMTTETISRQRFQRLQEELGYSPEEMESRLGFTQLTEEQEERAVVRAEIEAAKGWLENLLDSWNDDWTSQHGLQQALREAGEWAHDNWSDYQS